jgi:hypothetical protein
MFRRIINLLGFSILIVLVGCISLGDSAQLVDVTSTGNTSVLVKFSERIDKSMEQVSLYKILRPQLCDLNEWPAPLSITKVELNADKTSVTLTTMAQTGVNYQLIVAGMSGQAQNTYTNEGGEPLTFVGTPPLDAVDTDGDGISDADEQYGWAVRIGQADGTELCKFVTSDPVKRDTDMDGVEDNIEMALSTDPRSADTDGDNLSDKMEAAYASSPTHQDSDQDGISDGMEVTAYKTSPALKDTDGDGVDDLEEIVTGGRNPRLADLPQLDLQLYGSPLIVLNITEGTTQKQISSSLEQEKSEFQKTDTSTTKMSIENTTNLHVEVEAGTSNWPPSANAKLTSDTEFKASYAIGTSSSWTQNSVNEVKDTFENETTATTTFQNGIVAVSVKLVNNSNLSYKLKSPRVMAYQMTPGGNFSVIGTLEPGKIEISDDKTQHWVAATEASEYVIGPGGVVTVLVGAGDLPAQVMKPLMQNPTALMFELGSFSLFQLDEFGVEEIKNYDRVGEDILARTGLISIDYGNGRVERYSVATNLGRNADGSGSGVTMREALSGIIGLDYQTIDTEKGLSVLKQVGNEKIYSDGNYGRGRYEAYPASVIEKGQPYGYWLIGGTQEIFQSGDVPNFDDILLKSGDRVNLVWIEDQDGEGLPDREEYLLGTDPGNVDTDGDGLSDYEETRQGWSVLVKGQTAYTVYPDPLSKDSDDDGWSDKYESDKGTDPFLKDTDHDKLNDPDDILPLSGECIQDLKKLNLATWWIPLYDPAQKVYFANDIGISEGNSQFGSMSGYDPKQEGKDMVSEKGGDLYFSLNRGINANAQFITVNDDKFLSPTRDFTIAAWIIWDEEVASGKDMATVITKGTYALYVTKDGGLEFALQRNGYETCWLGSSDILCKDPGNFSATETVSTSANLIKRGVPYHVVVTFGTSEYMRIYVNGLEVKNYWVPNKHDSSIYTYQRDTRSLITNPGPLTIGNTLDGSLPFKGMLKDVQFFGQEMISDNVAKLYSYGLCVPNP